MSTTAPIQQANTASSRKMLQAMVGIGVLCALLIVLTYEGTLSRIETNKAEALERAIFKVLPGISQTAAYQLNADQTFSPATTESPADAIIYAGFDENNQLVGMAIPASGQGYADILRILYGYDLKQQAIVGMYVLESKETPGLGDKIEKDPAFLENFIALDVSLTDDLQSLNNQVIPVKYGEKKNPWEVDGITGATISSRAIGDILGASSAQWVPLIYQQQDAFKTTTTSTE